MNHNPSVVTLIVGLKCLKDRVVFSIGDRVVRVLVRNLSKMFVVELNEVDALMEPSVVLLLISLM